VAKRIETRYTPRIEFVLDQGVKKSIEVARILHEVLPHTAEEPVEESEDEESDGDAGSGVPEANPPPNDSENEVG
jgi:ribosome-binding factor A